MRIRLFKGDITQLKIDAIVYNTLRKLDQELN
jgi:O-acetyl-ADP-ribose deacetylase (regulator of RNase III)